MKDFLRLRAVLCVLMLVPFGSIKATSITDNINKYVRVSSSDELTENDTYIIVSEANNVAMGSVSSNKGAAIAAYTDSIEGVCYLEGFEGYTLDIRSGYYYIMYGKKYLYGVQYSTNINLGSLPVNDNNRDYYKWSISYKGKDAYINNYKDAESRAIVYGKNVYDKCFRRYIYSNTDLHSQLYKKVGSYSGIMLTIGETGYATMYYSDRSFTLPSEVTGYTATNFDAETGTLTLEATYQPGSVVPAGEAVILKGEAKPYALLDATESATKSESNLLRGTDESTPVSATNGYLYFFGVDNGEVGFYLASEDGRSFTNGAHKAYLELPQTASSSSAKAITIDFNDATKIDEIHHDSSCSDGQIYSLSGMKMQAEGLPQGIYIKNGHKFVVSK